MNNNELLRAAARCWERAGHYDRAAERWAAADAWSEAGRCLAQAGRHVDAAEAYGRAGDHVLEARQWLESPWPERARRVYRRVLEAGASGASEVEALLGLGEIGRALESAQNDGQRLDALRGMARMAAARGRPDLATRVWSIMALDGHVDLHEVWKRSTPWNRSSRWECLPERRREDVWPSVEFGGVSLKSFWREKTGGIGWGDCSLGWSETGTRFAAALDRSGENLMLGCLSADAVESQRWTFPESTICVAFVPGDSSILTGHRGGIVRLVHYNGTAEALPPLRMPSNVWSIAFSPRGGRVAISSYTSPGVLLQMWRWNANGSGERLDVRRESEGNCIPLCAWSPDGLRLVWSPGSAAYRLVFLTSNATQQVTDAHKTLIRCLSFSPNGRFLISASKDCAMVRTGENGQALVPPLRFADHLFGASLHPQATLLAIGEGTSLHLLRLHVEDPPRLTRLSERPMNEEVRSLAFSPDGRHLLVMTTKHLHLFRVHLTP